MSKELIERGATAAIERNRRAMAEQPAANTCYSTLSGLLRGLGVVNASQPV